MRKLMLALAVSALTPLLASPASAQVRTEMREMSVWPICLTAGEEASTRCEFATVAQCRATSEGNLQGTCIINPAYRSSAYAQYRPLTY
jgi:hypothetical protein